jgi:hypothetical protein
LQVHLYDEFPYPSGNAGGMVTQGNPAFQATSLQEIRLAHSGGFIRYTLPPGNVLAAYAYPIFEEQPAWDHPLNLSPYIGMVYQRESYFESGLTAYNQTRYFSNHPQPVLEITLPDYSHHLVMYIQQHIQGFKYYDTPVDPLNADAMDRFRKLTHHRYYEELHSYFGNPIVSMFVDEIAPGWSSHLLALFEQTYGYSLEPMLPALHHEDHPKHIQVRRDFDTLQYNQFCKQFEYPMVTWCQKTGIQYIGEKPSVRLHQLGLMDIPGCDAGHTRAMDRLSFDYERHRGNPRAVASAMYLFGKPGGLCEAFHSMGWGTTFYDLKRIVDALVRLGIHMIVPHAFYYSTHGLRKHDAPPSLFFQMPYWKFMNQFTTWIQQLTEVLTDTYLDSEILILDPHSGGINPTSQVVFGRLQQKLVEAHLDYYIGDESVFDLGTLIDSGFTIREVTFRSVVVPPMVHIPEKYQMFIQQFQEKDGTVLFIQTEDDINTCLATLTDQRSTPVSIHPEEPYQACDVEVTLRTDGYRRIWAIQNMIDESIPCIIQAELDLHEVSLGANGLFTDLEKTTRGYRRTLQPFELLLLQDRIKGTFTEQQKNKPSWDFLAIDIPTELDFELAAPNLYRIHAWELFVKTQLGWGSSIRVTTKPLLDQLHDSHHPIVPSYTSRFGQLPSIGFPDIEVRYEHVFLVSEPLPEPIYLLLEPDSLRGSSNIYINNNRIDETDFHPHDCFVRGWMGAAITSFVKPGDNVIRVDVQTDREDGGLVNPIYLAGEFAVHLTEHRLDPLKTYGPFEAYTQNGIPYYAQQITYSHEFDGRALHNADTCLIQLNFPETFHETVELVINDTFTQPILWKPYQVLVPADVLNPDKNIIRYRVYPGLKRTFEGYDNAAID